LRIAAQGNYESGALRSDSIPLRRIQVHYDPRNWRFLREQARADCANVSAVYGDAVQCRRRYGAGQINNQPVGTGKHLRLWRYWRPGLNMQLERFATRDGNLSDRYRACICGSGNAREQGHDRDSAEKSS
jgi:hypothetical protein